MAILYTHRLDTLDPSHLEGFFEGWPRHPDPATHLAILKHSYAVVLALDGDRCVGFVNALSDGILSASIPLLEVLPEYRGQGIGTELLRRMLEALGNLYAIDLLCDEELAPFYLRSGFARCAGMAKRNRAGQGGTLAPLDAPPPA